MPLTYDDRVVSKAVAWANARDRPLYLVMLGTRPCYIKLASLARALTDQDVPFLLVESGQHHDSILVSAKREFGYEHLVGVTLNARGPLLEFASQTFLRVGELAGLLGGLNLKHAPIPVVSGDTATAAYVPQAWYLRFGVRSVHVEAGLRTLGPVSLEVCMQDDSEADLQRSLPWIPIADEPFPEAACSRLASQVSRLFFAPVQRNRDFLLSEGCGGDAIEIVGSLSADAVTLRPTHEIGGVPEPCTKGEWIRVDLHRRENMTAQKLNAVFGAIELLGKKGLRTLLVLSNALVGALDRFSLWSSLDRIAKAGCLIHEPWVSYRSVTDFFRSGRCIAVYTDSGGVQEETCILGVPCFTCRFGTDRVETVLDFKSNLLVPPTTADQVATALMRGLSATSSSSANRRIGSPNPYGTDVGNRIASILKAVVPQPILPGALAAFRPSAYAQSS